MYFKIIKFFLVPFSFLTFTACSFINEPQPRFQSGFHDYFNTYIEITAYADNQQEFSEIFELARDEFAKHHALFDIYNNYENVNNIKTINDMAGISPVKVDHEIIELLTRSIDAYYKTDGALNIALGPVLAIWHNYREMANENPENAKMPPSPILIEASNFTDIDKVHIDEIESTVFLELEEMSLDIGAVAKGYTAQRVADSLIEHGVNNAVINAGGDIVVIGSSEDRGGSPWLIGVRNPDGGVLDTISIENTSVATSGDYQRGYIVNGLNMHHIVDPSTLMPSTNFSSVTVVHDDAFISEMMTTALFILNLEDGLKLADEYDSAVIWVTPEGGIHFNDAYLEISSTMNK